MSSIIILMKSFDNIVDVILFKKLNNLLKRKIYSLNLLKSGCLFFCLTVMNPIQAQDLNAKLPSENEENFIQANKEIINKPIPFLENKEFESLSPLPSLRNQELLKSIKLGRNPFSGEGLSVQGNDSKLPSNVRFTGVIKVGEETTALIATPMGVDIYEEGQKIGKGFSITKISTDPAFLEISNGKGSKLIELDQVSGK